MLARNFSYPLHEASDSPVVWAAVQQSIIHSLLLSVDGGLRLRTLPVFGEAKLNDQDPNLVLSLRIGVPAALNRAVFHATSQPLLIIADGPGGTKPTSFFRGVAQLSLPVQPVERVVVAAAVLRPGSRSIELLSSDALPWPEARGALICQLESVVREHLPQWIPSHALFDVPAEAALEEFSQRR